MLGYFRGQWLTSETEIKLSRTPELVINQLPPGSDAAVAVRAENDLDVGAIAIVLDFSGSMGELPLKPGQKEPAKNWRTNEQESEGPRDAARRAARFARRNADQPAVVRPQGR